MKIIARPEVAVAVDEYLGHAARRKAFVAKVKEEMAALNVERDQLLSKLSDVNKGKPFVIPEGEGYRVVEFRKKEGLYDAEKMAETLKSIRRKPARKPDESVVIVRGLTLEEIEILPK